MLLVFIDETSDSKFKDYLGFSVATINSLFYPSIKKKVQTELAKIGWDSNIEFKGSYLFSASKGCADIEIERRIDAAHKLFDLNVATSNRNGDRSKLLNFLFRWHNGVGHTCANPPMLSPPSLKLRWGYSFGRQAGN